LRVLDTTSEVIAPTAGTIAGHGAAVGDLAEFGTVLVRLQP
jgi:pyruvate/2-oxoglutarate dehydrogenase complex dihydrolipoamide acyltransferase (E2) component